LRIVPEELSNWRTGFCRSIAISAVAALLSTQPAGAQTTGNAATDDDPVVAIVGTQPILESYVQRSIRELVLGNQIDVRSRRSDFIDSIIREEVLFQYALKTLGDDPQWRDAVKAMIVQKLLETRIRDKTQVSDEDAKAYYIASTQDTDGEHINLFDIKFADRRTCEAQLKAIKTLDDFKRVARQFHVDPELAASEGGLGVVMTSTLIFGYGPQLKGLAENTPHKIINDGACHIVWITDRELLSTPAFEEVRERIKGGLRAGAEAELLEALLQEAENSVSVTRIIQD